MKHYIVYHRDCLDGFVSAILVYTRALYLGTENIVMIPANYGEGPVNVKSGDTVTLVDFSYSSEVIDKMLKYGANVVIADHHKTAIEDIAGNIKKAINNEESQYPFKGMTFDSDINIVADGNQYPLSSNSLQDYLNCIPVVDICNCIDDDFSLFSDLIFKDKNPCSKFAGYLAYSDANGKNNISKRSAAGIVYQKLKGTISNKTENQLKFILGNDIGRLVELAQSHDLWLHDGDYTDKAMQLSYWFKHFKEETDDITKSLQELPNLSADKLLRHSELSVALFELLRKNFLSTTLNEKLAIGKEILDKDVFIIKEILKDTKTVKLNDSICSDVKVGYIHDERLKKVGVSLTGSIMVRDGGYDVAILSTPNHPEESDIIYSLRSNGKGSNVDLTNITKHFVSKGIASTGGGHVNAAGMKVKKELSFFEIIS